MTCIEMEAVIRKAMQVSTLNVVCSTAHATLALPPSTCATACSAIGAWCQSRQARPPAVHIGAEGHAPLLPQVATAGGTHLKVAGVVHAFDPVHTAQQLRKDHLQAGGWVGLGGLHACRGLDT